MATISALSVVRNPPPEPGPAPPGREMAAEAEAAEAPEEETWVADKRQELAARCAAVTALVVQWAAGSEAVRFKDFEKALRQEVFGLARAALELFLALREQRVMERYPERFEGGGRTFRRAPAHGRRLTTVFGVVHYVRTYMREVGRRGRGGFHPLDVSLGLSTDRFSWNVLSAAVRLATKLSFAEARSTLGGFIPNAPSTEVIEQSVLGLGRHSAEWFETAPPPEDDGEVLVVMIDSKGAPTATEQELKRRRGKRRKSPLPRSRRHRGRKRRGRYPSKPRRKKGDKSKNAKMATMVVMYTLKRHGDHLLGPINTWHYASFAPKKHAFEVARREADKRGFAEGSGKLVQLVMDGDLDLARYGTELFPTAIHTVDVMHVVEKLWSAGESIFPEGSDELRDWVDKQKERLYGGNANAIVRELRRRLDATPKTGPGNKGKRQRLRAVLGYLEKRLDKMRYDELLEQDLELGTGAVEGAIKNIVGKRCDHGGMRWIKERAEALLQLRCIEANGHWDAFIDRVHDRIQAEAERDGRRLRLQSSTPAPLPSIPLAA